jgi:hypothetical protein
MKTTKWNIYKEFFYHEPTRTFIWKISHAEAQRRKGRGGEEKVFVWCH